MRPTVASSLDLAGDDFQGLIAHITRFLKWGLPLRSGAVKTSVLLMLFVVVWGVKMGEEVPRHLWHLGVSFVDPKFGWF